MPDRQSKIKQTVEQMRLEMHNMAGELDMWKRRAQNAESVNSDLRERVVASEAQLVLIREALEGIA